MRLWLVALVCGCAAGVGLGAGLAGGSMWPAVGLFAIFAVVACVAAACDASAADIAAQDVGDMSERMSAMEQRLENDSKAMAQVINDHAADIEHLKKKGALDFALGQ